LTALADRSYFKGEEILQCERSGINALVPKPQTSNSQAKGQFDKRDFRYIPAETSTGVRLAMETLKTCVASNESDLIASRALAPTGRNTTKDLFQGRL
jgi:hypothetical protein